MENENLIPESQPEMDSFEREERCRRTMKNVSKAILMRLAVTVILLWVMVRNSMKLWVVGMICFVLIINLTGILPLAGEWKKRRQELKEIIAEDEE